MLPEHFFWITSRAAGTASLLLSSLAVCACEAWFVAATAIVVVPALALLAIRMSGAQRRPRTTRTSSGAPVARSPGPAVRGVSR
jgi:hypothetical protein